MEKNQKIKGSLFIGILSATALAIITGKVELPPSPIALNIDISPIAFKMDILGALRWSFVSAIFSLMFIDLFDSLGTLVAVSYEANLVEKDGNIPKLGRLLSIDAAATMFGALMGTSTTTSYLESAAGIEQGGRTGLTSIVTGLIFLAGLFFIPIIGIVPTYATAPALIMVGLLMMRRIVDIDFKDMEIAIPSFLVIILVSLTYSISTGLAFGFVFYVLIKIVLREKNMNVGKLAVMIITVFLVIGHSGAIAQQRTTELSLGEELVRELWNDFKTQNIAALQSKMAPGFQSIHEDGARNREEELELLKGLNLGDYTLSDFKVIEVGPTIIVSYFVSVAETIEDERLSIKPAARLTIFLKTDSGWQWIAHANLKPLKQ